MKLLLKNVEISDVTHAQILLESRGIPVFVGNANSASAFGIAPARIHTLWVVLDHQYDDALALLDDEGHEVTDPVDVQEYYRLAEQSQKEGADKIFNAVMLVIVVVVIALAAVYVLMSGNGA